MKWAPTYTCFRMLTTQAVSILPETEIPTGRYPGLVTAKSTQFALKCFNDVEVKLRTHMGKEVEESIASRKDDTEETKKQNTPQLKVFNGIKWERTYFGNNVHIFTFLNWESPWDTLLSRFQLAFSPVPFYIFLLLHLGPSSKGQPSRWNDPQLLKCQGSMAEGGTRWRKYRSAHGTCQFTRGMEGSERHTERGRGKWKVQSPGIVTSMVRGSHSLT